MKSLLVGYFVFFSLSAFALVPVEGILLGESHSEIQEDPLNFIFSEVYDKSNTSENKKFKLYQNTINRGVLFQEACSLYGPPVYESSWQEKQAKRAVASALQYIGIESSVKAIGAYADLLKLDESAYKTLTSNLINNYCSKNITVHSLKKISASLDYYYKNVHKNSIPSVESSPFASSLYKKTTESPEARSREFDQAINNFKAFCSWGGDVSDYRLLVPYLKNNTIMALVMKNMSGLQDQYDPYTGKIEIKPSPDTVQISCNELICRKVPSQEFIKNFPLSKGSSGVTTDLFKLYCHHFRLQDYSNKDTIPEVKTWIKNMELEDPIFETNFFISLLTGVPDAIFGADTYRDIPLIAKSSIDDRWSAWANQIIKFFSRELLFEESLKIRTEPRRNAIDLRQNGFHLEFTVTLGEMDRIVDNTDKLKLSFDLVFTKNYLRYIRSRWAHLSKELNEEGKEKFIETLARQVEIQLRGKEKYFNQKMWNEDFSHLIVKELVGQILAYEGPMFDSYEEKVLKMPVKFSYGIFALSYLRYRADVKAGRLNLNL